MTDRTIKVRALTRVEGEGGLHLRIRDGAVDQIQLEIYEPPRLFESLLRGRDLEDTPDITARICGICPVAYQMSSVHALEDALGVRVSPEIRQLRRLLYCGEWIESHALHVYLLHAPDFFGVDSGLALAKQQPDELNRGLRMKKHGNQLLEILGGRAIHPINVAVGGFYRAPRADLLTALLPDLQWCLEAAVATAHWVAKFDYPDFECEYQMVAISHDDEYAMNEGDIRAVGNGVDETISVDQFDTQFEERQVEHSTALHSQRRDSGASYLVGPLARVGLNGKHLTPTARSIAEQVGVDWPSHNPFHSIIARSVELIHAFEEAIGIIQAYRPPKPARVPYEYRQGTGCAATEAPRGLLYHRYSIDDAGKLTKAVIVPPTSQNQAQIENDLRRFAPSIVSHDDAEAGRQLENLVRCYDPCISCSTHFLKVSIDRG